MLKKDLDMVRKQNTEFSERIIQLERLIEKMDARKDKQDKGQYDQKGQALEQ